MPERVVPQIRQKATIMWAILDEECIVLKKPKELSWKVFYAMLFRTFEDEYNMKEVLKGFRFAKSKSGLEFGG